MILEKMRSCLGKLELGIWSYGWIRLLGPSGPSVVFRPKTPRSGYFLRFHHFIAFFSWFWKKWGPVCENWNYGSGLMAGHVFWAQVAQVWQLGPKIRTFFEISSFYCIDLMILDKMRSCLWKLELRFSTNGLISPLPKVLGPNCPKLGFRPQTPNVKALGSEIFFMSSSIKFCIK